jgi:nicotinamidase-related amidase
VPLTHLDPQSALVVIDLQKGIVAMPTAHPTAEIVSRTAQLARLFRDRGLPVVLVNVTGRPAGRTDTVFPQRAFPPDWTELVAELEQQRGDIPISKRCVDAFTGTSLDESLRARGVTQIFLTGIVTGGGVEGTGRHAFDLGYNVVFVSDAMTDRSLDAHLYCLEKVFPRFGEVDITANVLVRLQPQP